MPLPIELQDIFKHKQKSYKMVLIHCLLDELSNGQLLVPIEKVRQKFLAFFQEREAKGLPVDIPPASVGTRWSNVSPQQIQRVLDTPIQALSNVLEYDQRAQVLTFRPYIAGYLQAVGMTELRELAQQELDNYHNNLSVEIPLRDHLHTILSGYMQAKTERFAEHDLGVFVRQTIKQEFEKLPFITAQYKVQGSVGQGNWANIPWIAIMDRRITETTQKGVYIVYLFSEDMSRVYLTLIQGVTEPIQIHGRPEAYARFREQVNRIREQLGLDEFTKDENIYLTDGGLGRDYQVSTIAYARYDRENLPSNTELLADLKKMLEYYEQFVEQMLSNERPKFNYTMLKLSYAQGVVQYMGERAPRSIPLQELAEHQSIVLRSGDAKHPLERVRQVARAFEELGLVSIEANAVSLTPLGIEYYSHMEADIWNLSQRQIDIIRDQIANPALQTELVHVLRMAVDIVEERKRFTPAEFMDSFVQGMGTSGIWGEVTQENRSKFMLSWLHELQYIEKQEDGTYRFVEREEAVKIPDSAIATHLQTIKTYIQQRGFQYPDHLIENFYLSLKTKPFVILAGISGTGKTKLVKLFAEAVGATSANGQFRLIPVRTDWSDPTDLIGYRDLTGTFRPGPLTEVLVEACKPENRYKPYFICLDEMNLARVEHYFSDVLSLIETQERRAGRIVTDRLIPPNHLGEADLPRYGNVHFPDNVFLIGTVNMDETTHPFSKKVLDRGNTLEFHYIALDNFPDTESLGESVEVQALPASFLSCDYLTLQEAYTEYADLIRRTTAKLVKINQILEQIHAHVGFRVRDAICFYLIYNQRFGLLPEVEAFDLQLAQKILPRIQGSSMAVKRTILHLLKITLNDRELNLEEMMGDASSLYEQNVEGRIANARYKHSSHKLLFMLRRLEEDGFTSFWIS